MHQYAEVWMSRFINAVTLVVKDYDEAIDFYTNKLDFELIEDTRLTDEKRWVLIAPRGAKETRLLLAKAANAEQSKSIGNQTGGRVFLFLQTDDFWNEYQSMKEKGVVFCETPREESYGTVVVFQDLCGNKWDLLQLR
jgi:catechol 2,3-dioxygenase-like lactoylglutathione lyase family enzyme